MSLDPLELGAPERFSLLRPQQQDALSQALASTRRFITLCLPTGTGKSAINQVLALLAKRRRALQLTSTRGLQDQYQSDWAYLVDVRGRQNYPCPSAYPRDYSPTGEGNCEDGSDEGCELYYEKDGGGAGSACPFKLALGAAARSKLVNTNYSCWFHNGPKLGAFGLLLCDEAHDLPEAVSDFLKIEFSRWEVCEFLRQQPPEEPLDVLAWVQWGEQLLPTVKAALANKNQSLKVRRRLRSLQQRIEQLAQAGAHADDWIAEETEDHRQNKGWAIQPVWPAAYAEYALFRQVPRVVLSSATIRPKGIALLGIKPEDNDFFDAPSVFPATRRPVRAFPTVRMDFRTPADGYRRWARRADEWIASRGDEKGVFHTHSYKLQRAYLELSRQKFSRVFANSSARDLKETVQAFREAEPPAVLVSPSVTTGFDFPYDACRYQLIGKVPYPDTRSRVMERRCKEDPEYRRYVTMTRIVQMVGRGMRAEDDTCETAVIDDHFKRTCYECVEHAPLWFRESVEFDAQL